MLTVACVLRSGGDFDGEYVERLHHGIAEHLSVPHRFVCLSDVPVSCERIPLAYDWPGWFAKLELFRPDLTGDLLYFDLDSIPVGPLDDLVVDRLAMIRDFWKDWSASGVMYLPEADRTEVWKAWIRNPTGHMAQCGKQGDGKFIREVYRGREAHFQTLWPGQVVSYKTHVMRRSDRGANRRSLGNGTVPPGARLVCFHGYPRPRDIGWQLRFSEPYSTRPSEQPSSARATV